MIAICNNLAHSAEFKTQLHRVSITFNSCSNHSFFSFPFPSLSQDTKAYCLCKVFVPPDGKLSCVSRLEFIQWTRLTLHYSLWIKIILISSPSHLMAARTIFNVKINYRVNMWKHFFNWSNSFCRSKPDFRWFRVQCAALARQTASLDGANTSHPRYQRKARDSISGTVSSMFAHTRSIVWSLKLVSDSHHIARLLPYSDTLCPLDNEKWNQRSKIFLINLSHFVIISAHRHIQTLSFCRCVLTVSVQTRNVRVNLRYSNADRLQSAWNIVIR